MREITLRQMSPFQSIPKIDNYFFNFKKIKKSNNILNIFKEKDATKNEHLILRSLMPQLVLNNILIFGTYEMLTFRFVLVFMLSIIVNIFRCRKK